MSFQQERSNFLHKKKNQQKKPNNNQEQRLTQENQV